MSYILAIFLGIVSALQFWLTRDQDEARLKKEQKRSAKAYRASTKEEAR